MSRTWVILLAGAVTIIPRTIPYFVSALDRLPRCIRKCMMLLPIAALGALVFPMSLLEYGEEWYAGLAGVLASFLASYLKAPMIVSIIAAMAVTAACLLL